jgi:large subunit ribosomal protein L35
MPKQRAHSGAKKRFRVTRTGKVLHVRQNMNHLFEGKSSRRKRRLTGTSTLERGQAALVKHLLGER